MVNLIQDILLQSLSELGMEWSNFSVESLRLRIEVVKIFRGVNTLIAEENLRAEDIRERCREFNYLYERVMMRPIEEIISNADE